MTLIEFMDERYENREDKDNIWKSIQDDIGKNVNDTGKNVKAESEDKDADKKCTYKETGCGSCKRQLDCPIEADMAESEPQESEE